MPPAAATAAGEGEASAGEIATAIAEWLATVKHRMAGHDRFQLAVARNALGIIARAEISGISGGDRALAQALLAGNRDLAEPGLLARLRSNALAKLAVDIPKYPALAAATAQWTGEQ